MPLTEAEVDKILASGDVDKIDALFDAIGDESTDSEDEGAEAEAATEGNGEEQTTDDSENNSDEEEGDTSGADEDASEQYPTSDEIEGDSKPERDERYIESKQGGNKIPYSVLEGARKRAQEAETKLAEALEKMSDLESRSTTYSKQLEKAGIDLGAIQDGSQSLTPERLAAINDLDPELGGVVGAMFAEMQDIKRQVGTSKETISPVDLAIRDNSDLSAWRKGDPDRWDLAVQLDDQLKVHPEWKHASLEDRFAEAARLTKLEFGDAAPQSKPNPAAGRAAAKAKANAKVKAAEDSAAPQSLTDIGQSPSTEKTRSERMKDMSEAEIAAEMANMTDAQIEALLDGA